MFKFIRDIPKTISLYLCNVVDDVFELLTYICVNSPLASSELVDAFWSGDKSVFVVGRRGFDFFSSLTKILVFLASLLDVQHERDSVEIKPASSLLTLGFLYLIVVNGKWQLDSKDW